MNLTISLTVAVSMSLVLDLDDNGQLLVDVAAMRSVGYTGKLGFPIFAVAKIIAMAKKVRCMHSLLLHYCNYNLGYKL